NRVAIAEVLGHGLFERQELDHRSDPQDATKFALRTNVLCEIHLPQLYYRVNAEWKRPWKTKAMRVIKWARWGAVWG
ncbi:hypothetical protein, partial [Mesorhizobium salmacidum]